MWYAARSHSEIHIRSCKYKSYLNNILLFIFFIDHFVLIYTLDQQKWKHIIVQAIRSSQCRELIPLCVIEYQDNLFSQKIKSRTYANIASHSTLTAEQC